MKIKPKDILVKDLVKGYKDSAENGVVGYGGKLNIRPAFQREFVYGESKRNEVIKTIQKGFPLNVMYWGKNEKKDSFEIIDGQQRTISICQYVNGDFSINNMAFGNLTKTEQEQILNYKLMVYICDGNDKERLDWFRVINIAGEILTPQELRNATYTGEWLTDAKKHFSRTGCPASDIAGKYMNGSAIRQEHLETILKWISNRDGIEIEGYMSKHQHDKNCNELWNYFDNIFEWVKTKVFGDCYYTEMKGLDWGGLYEKYHENRYSPKKIEKRVSDLMGDLCVTNKKGIFEYVLGGEKRPELLNIRVFDDRTKKAVYKKQTDKAKKKGVSNCPYCASGDGANKTKIWAEKDMDADHITAWSKGGATDISNCQMLCKVHNNKKSNA